jgi:tripartite-type tricarboxylate transporter receptor subunit TctC
VRQHPFPAVAVLHCRSTVALVLARAFAAAAPAQSDFPNRPITLLLAFTAGFTSDLSAQPSRRKSPAH